MFICKSDFLLTFMSRSDMLRYDLESPTGVASTECCVSQCLSTAFTCCICNTLIPVGWEFHKTHCWARK